MARFDDSGLAVGFGLVAGASVVIPLVVGVAVGHPVDGGVVGIGAWLVAVRANADPPGVRAVAMLAGVLSLAFGTVLGVVVIDREWLLIPVAPLVAGAGILWPLVGSTAALALLITAANPLPMYPAEHLGLQLLGGLLAAVLITLPWSWRRTRPLPATLGEAAEELAVLIESTMSDSWDSQRVRASSVLQTARTACARHRWERRSREAEQVTVALRRIFYEAVALHDLVGAVAREVPPDRVGLSELVESLAASVRSLFQPAEKVESIDFGARIDALRGERPGDERELLGLVLLRQIAHVADRIREGVAESRSGVRSLTGTVMVIPQLPEWPGARKRRPSSDSGLPGMRSGDSAAEGLWPSDRQSADQDVLGSSHSGPPGMPPVDSTGGVPAVTSRIMPRVSLDDPDVRHSLRVGLGTVVACVAIVVFEPLHAQWLALTVLLTIQPTYGETLAKVWARILGSVIGGLAAALVLLIAPGDWVRVVMVGVAAMLAFGLVAVHYAYWATFMTMCVLLLIDFQTPLSPDAAAIRVGLTVCGAMIALACTRLLWPRGEAVRLAERVARLLESHAEAARMVADVSRGNRPERLAVERIHVAAREAEAVAQSVSSIAYEPGVVPPQHVDEVLDTARRIRDDLMTVTTVLREDPGEVGPAPGVLDAVADRLATGAEAVRIGEPYQSGGDVDSRLADLGGWLGKLADRRLDELAADPADSRTRVRRALLHAAATDQALRALSKGSAHIVKEASIAK
ncbi:FUSC family protein [Acrocarpospora macrocephala]|uniref:Fusaric acid resistance protein n=1 Tax=Acrocarpospora macrocephala TaxID=150177 RepID=A0A5M3WIT0_9ACTN|nr:FUSC family protein [Acrocarpospora macrocephala]GES08250.1 fusaric acid resistance protein [Acrocarpospora macrocephala]